MRKKVGALVTIIILILLFFTLKDIQFKEIYTALTQINISYVLLALVAFLIYYMLWALRLKNTLAGYVKASYFYLLKIVWAGAFVNTITPGVGVGGEPVRAYYIGEKYNKPKTKVLGFIAADQFFNILGLTLYVIASTILIFFLIDITVLKNIIPIILVALALISVLAFYVFWKNAHKELHWIEKRLYHLKSIRKHFKTLPDFEKYFTRKFHNITNILKEAITNRNKLSIGIILSVIYRSFEYVAAYVIFLALGQDISLAALLVVVTFAHLLGDISPIPGGIGLVESAMIVLYSAVGVPIHIAALVALLTRTAFYFYTVLVGGLTLLSLQKNK